MVSSSVESVSLVVAQASAICSNCLHRLPNCLLSVMIMCTAVSEEAARIRCWARARSSSSELVDTATARRQQRVEDAARAGLQFPFRSERRGRGAPSVAMKWRDAVKAAIMHGLCHRMSLSMRRIGGYLECCCCHRRTTWRQCR